MKLRVVRVRPERDDPQHAFGFFAGPARPGFLSPQIIRADGLRIPDLLEGILPLLELDTFADDPLLMMAPVAGDSADPAVAHAYRGIVEGCAPEAPPIRFLERFEFYERAREAFAVVMTGDTAKYGNLLLRKGVTPA